MTTKILHQNAFALTRKVSAIFALLLICATLASTALALDVVAKMSDRDDCVIAFLTGISQKPNGKDKDAMISIFVNDNDKDPVLVIFPDADAWAKFTVLWGKAMMAGTPSKGSGGIRIGDYTSPDGTLLSVTKYDTGSVVVGAAAGLGGPHVVARTFSINSEGFSMFNDAVVKVTKILGD